MKQTLFISYNEVKTEKEARIDALQNIDINEKMDEVLIELGFEGESELTEELLKENEKVYNSYVELNEYSIDHSIINTPLVVDIDTTISDARFFVDKGNGAITSAVSSCHFNKQPQSEISIEEVDVADLKTILEHFDIPFDHYDAVEDDEGDIVEDELISFTDLNGSKVEVRYV